LLYLAAVLISGQDQERRQGELDNNTSIISLSGPRNISYTLDRFRNSMLDFALVCAPVVKRGYLAFAFPSRLRSAGQVDRPAARIGVAPLRMNFAPVAYFPSRSEATEKAREQ
jgi:hypothetical protein